MIQQTPIYTEKMTADEKRAYLLRKVSMLTETQAATALDLLAIYFRGTEAEREALKRLTAGLDTLTDAQISANWNALEQLIKAFKAREGGADA